MPLATAWLTQQQTDTLASAPLPADFTAGLPCEQGPKSTNFVSRLGGGLEGHLPLARALDRALTRDLALERALASIRATRATARILLLAAVISLKRLKSSEQSWRGRLLRSLKRTIFHTTLLPDFMNYVKRSYIALAILEDRIEGKRHAFEGIRITKVRRQPEAEA